MRTILLSTAAALVLTASAFAQGGGQGAQDSGAQQRPMINSPGGGGKAPGMGGGEMQRAPDGAGMQRQGAGADTRRQGDTAQDNRNQAGQDQAQGDRNQPGQKAQGGQNDRAGAVGNTGDRTRINITNNNQRTVIRNNIVRGNVRLPAGVTVAVGTRLPATIAFHPVPAAIIAEVPALEPYYYVVVDGQVVFVDPATYEIVYVMPV
jgi:hypothetical protein